MGKRKKNVLKHALFDVASFLFGGTEGHWCWGLNLGPHSGWTGAVPHEPHPQPLLLVAIADLKCPLFSLSSHFLYVVFNSWADGVIWRGATMEFPESS
jgi:hypothetical protein